MQFATPRSPTKDGSFTDTASVIGPMWSSECWYDGSAGSTTSITGGGPRINSWHILAYMPGNVRSLAAKSSSSLWWSTTSTMFLLSMAGQYRFKEARRGIVWYLYKTQSRTHMAPQCEPLCFSTETHLSSREPMCRHNANRCVFPQKLVCRVANRWGATMRTVVFFHTNSSVGSRTHVAPQCEPLCFFHANSSVGSRT